MYDLTRYDNLFPPSAWLVVISLALLLYSHLMVRILEFEIRRAITCALERCKYADTLYIAQPIRRNCQHWRDRRYLCAISAMFGMVGWLISL